MKKMQFLRCTAFLTAAISLLACSLTGEDDDTDKSALSGNLSISLSTSVIQANGKDTAVIIVKKGADVLKDGVTIYDAKSNAPLSLPDMAFTATKAGEYSFWAAYGTEHTGTVTVTAIDFEVPTLPEDEMPSSVNFNKKLLLTQFTGTGCGYCPFMVNLIKKLKDDKAYADRFELAVAHTFNSNDPAYLDAPLNQAMGVPGYPMVVFDMHTKFNNYNAESSFRKAFDDTYGRSEAKAGISAASYVQGNTLVVKIAAKAAEKGEYRVGAWLLEDGINGRQTNNGASPEAGVNFDVHNNCIRVADSRVSSSNYTGYSLGELEKGAIGEHVFVITLKDSWVKENMHLLLFVTSHEAGGFAVTNSASCKLHDTINYSYN